MTERELVTASRLRELLHYEPITGVFTWLCPAGHRARIGDVAGTLHSDGCRHIGIDERRYKEHRLAWLYMTGEWPREEIDHANRVRDDNRWANLRHATHSQNLGNGQAHIDNSCGLKGVVWHAPSRMWRARIQVNKKQIHLGLFESREIAYAAYLKAAQRHFGEFARG